MTPSTPNAAEPAQHTPSLLSTLRGASGMLTEAGKDFANHNPYAVRPNLYELHAKQAEASVDVASELLTQLCEITDLAERYGVGEHCDGNIIAARAAIAKATGGTGRSTDHFDFGCGQAYHQATPLRQAQGRLAYWQDLLGQVQADPDRFTNVGDHCRAAKAGIREARAVIAREGKTPSPSVSITLPPDPEDMNDKRAEWARAALHTFMAQTRQTDEHEALRDLLVNTLHLADRMNLPEGSREAMFDAAAVCYREETTK